MKKGVSYFNATEDRAYTCEAPKQYGLDGRDTLEVCIHGWNTPHCLSEKEAQLFDHLINCGVIKGPTQIIEKIERKS